MFEKMFALASVTALTGLVATVAAAGCSSTTTVADGDAGPVVSSEGGPKKEGGIVVPPEEAGTDGGGTPEEKTVGKECASTADCKVDGTKNDNSCSKGFFTVGDLFGSPVCVQGSCTQGTGGTIGDLLCDGDATSAPGLCLPNGANTAKGICFPFCSFDSMAVVDKCAGGNKCNIAYTGTDPMTKKVSAIGFCFGACTADTDCKGTAGQKCQVEEGLCVNADKHVTFTAVGTACIRTATGGTATCNCNLVGNHADGGISPDADKGYCTHSCITGTAGDGVCAAAKPAGATTWKCTAKLPTVDSKGAALFNAQPADVSGTCAQSCTADADCAALATASSLTGLVKCKTYADGKYCDATAD